MGWKIIIITCMLAIFCTAEVQAATYTTYEGNISSTYLDIFDSISIPVGSEYVVFRDSQYTYRLFYGDLELSDYTFIGSGTVVTVTQNSNNYNNYNNYYSIESVEDNSFSLNVSDRLVYSSLGGYPSMYEEGYYYQLLILLALCIIIIINIVRPIFDFVQRKGVKL